MITQKELKQILHYCPNNGLFTRLKSSGTAKSGDTAGGLSSDGYIVASIKNKRYRVHRLVWLYVYGAFPVSQIDHVNHVRTDNRISNLREATARENHKNMTLQSNNKSGVAGISWVKRNSKWRARIKINRKEKSLGYFSDKFEAICAKLSANNRYGFHENHGR